MREGIKINWLAHQGIHKERESQELVQQVNAEDVDEGGREIF